MFLLLIHCTAPVLHHFHVLVSNSSDLCISISECNAMHFFVYGHDCSEYVIRDLTIVERSALAFEFAGLGNVKGGNRDAFFYTAIDKRIVYKKTLGSNCRTFHAEEVFVPRTQAIGVSLVYFHCIGFSWQICARLGHLIVCHSPCLITNSRAHSSEIGVLCVIYCLTGNWIISLRHHETNHRLVFRVVCDCLRST